MSLNLYYQMLANIGKQARVKGTGKTITITGVSSVFMEYVAGDVYYRETDLEIINE